MTSLLTLRSNPDTPVADARVAHLVGLARANTSMPRALCALDAYHQGLSQTYAEPREHEERAGFHMFPRPAEVPHLLRRFMARLSALFEGAESQRDDALIAAFAGLSVMMIHAFKDGNGRTAIDFAAFLLMKRGGLDQPPFQLEGDNKYRLGRIATMVVPGARWLDHENEWQSGKRVEEFLENATVDQLRRSMELRGAAMALFGVRPSGVLESVEK